MAFTDADARNGAKVALISDALWRTRFGGAASAVGAVVRINGEPSRIVGIMPPGFRFPFNGDIWRPLAVQPSAMEAAVKAFGRLRPE